MKKTYRPAPAGIGLTERETNHYSWRRAILSMLDFRQYGEQAKFELECSSAAKSLARIETPGMTVPPEVLHRDLSAGTATAGAELVATELRAGSFIDILRNRAVAINLGATMMSGLQGNVAIPRKTSGASFGWIASEGGDASQSDPQFDQVSMSPKTMGVYTEYTRRLMLQSSIDVEQMIKNDFAAAAAVGLDLACLYGSGASGQPTGIVNQSGINAPTSFAAATPTWAEVVAMETAVAEDNADGSNMGYVIEPAMRGNLKAAEKSSGTGEYIYDTENPDTPLNGYRCGVTSNVTAGDVFFGNWSDLIIGMWGLDLLVDPYSNSASGTVRISGFLSVDIALRHPESFAYNNDGV